MADCRAWGSRGRTLEAMGIFLVNYSFQLDTQQHTATIHLQENPRVQTLLACCDSARRVRGGGGVPNFSGGSKGHTN